MEYRNLKQQYCGLVNVPNMHDNYSCFYDWGNHFLNEGVTFEDLWNAYEDITVYDIINIVKRIKNGETGLEDMLHKAQFKNMVNFILDFYDLRDNPVAKQLPDKCIKAIDAWVDELYPDSYKQNNDSTKTSENGSGK